jgi:hypothetical protein
VTPLQALLKRVGRSLIPTDQRFHGTCSDIPAVSVGLSFPISSSPRSTLPAAGIIASDSYGKSVETSRILSSGSLDDIRERMRAISILTVKVKFSGFGDQRAIYAQWILLRRRSSQLGDEPLGSEVVKFVISSFLRANRNNTQLNDLFVTLNGTCDISTRFVVDMRHHLKDLPRCPYMSLRYSLP